MKENECSIHDLGKHVTAIVNEHLTPEKAEESAGYIKSSSGNLSPKIGIICGSGCDGIGDLITEPHSIDYKDIPNFPVPTGVPGHKGRLILGYISGKPVACMLGRFHAYEGYSTASCTFPVRVLRLLGVDILFLTSACGSLNPDYQIGDFMLIKDHINLPGITMESPLLGKNYRSFGVRFLDMVGLYDHHLRQVIKSIVFNDAAAADDVTTTGQPDEMGTVSDCGELRRHFREGVHVSIGGPAYETIAEVLMLRSFGADAVGMSLTHEATVARHNGMRVVGVAIISDKAPTDYDQLKHVTEEEVVKVVHRCGELLKQLVEKFVERVDKL